MALTKDEIKARIVRKLAPQYRTSLTWAQLVAGVGDATQLQKQAILQAVIDNDAQLVGSRLIALAAAKINGLASADADSILADDNLTLAELERIL
jgi:hypothetical protein